MYAVSEAFHEAIREDELQLPLLLFDDAVVTPRDINISSGGIGYQASVNEGEDFAPGGCSAALLSFDLLNDDNTWTGYDFGAFKAYLGVRTNVIYESPNCVCRIDTGSFRIRGNDKAPFLTLNDAAVSGVTERVEALALLNDKLLVFTKNQTQKFTFKNGELTAGDFTFYEPPIQKAAVAWKTMNYGVCFGHKGTRGTGIKDENNLMVFTPTSTDIYEMVPLGVFYAEKPVFNSRKTLSIDAYDAMSLFDTQYREGTIAFPTTLQNLVDRVCKAVGVTLGSTQMVNGERTVSSAPEAFAKATYRDILGWCAELGGCFARINRDGALELKWFSDAGYSLTAHDYSEYDVGYYTRAGVDRLIIRDSAGDDVITGAGVNSLYIVDNPIAAVIT